MKDIREYDGKQYEAVTIRDVSKGDFIKVGNNLVEIIDKSVIRDPETGRLINWSITGKDGLAYGMRDVDLYLKQLGD